MFDVPVKLDCKLDAQDGATPDHRGAPAELRLEIDLWPVFRSDDVEIVWDPYVVTAIADLIAFVDDARARADFLNSVAGPLLQPGEACHASKCPFASPGLINLQYALTTAKVNGLGPWPVKEAATDLAHAMQQIDVIVWDSGHVDDRWRGRRAVPSSELVRRSGPTSFRVS